MPSPRRQVTTVRLRRLAAELGRLRDAAGLSREQVTERTELNVATLYRIETARARPQRRTLTALLDVYGVSGAPRDDLLKLARDAGEQGWLQPYQDVLPEGYSNFIQFEDSAKSMRLYESLFIPGLLQTAAYTRAVTRAGLPMATEEDVEVRVRVRASRQARLSGPNPLTLWSIVDEAALHRLNGGAEVMAEQLRHLLVVAEQPNVTFQVIPFPAGAHAGMAGSFEILDYPDPADPSLVYLESMAGNLFLETTAEVERYTLLFDHLRAVALGPADSVRMLADLAGRLTKEP
jgi:transcriptional regulator with XRE-family HTH domain